MSKLNNETFLDEPIYLDEYITPFTLESYNITCKKFFKNLNKFLIFITFPFFIIASLFYLIVFLIHPRLYLFKLCLNFENKTNVMIIFFKAIFFIVFLFLYIFINGLSNILSIILMLMLFPTILAIKKIENKSSNDESNNDESKTINKI